MDLSNVEDECVQALREQHQGVILSKAMVLGVQQAYLIV